MSREPKCPESTDDKRTLAAVGGLLSPSEPEHVRRLDSYDFGRRAILAGSPVWRGVL